MSEQQLPILSGGQFQAQNPQGMPPPVHGIAPNLTLQGGIPAQMAFPQQGGQPQQGTIFQSPGVQTQTAGFGGTTIPTGVQGTRAQALGPVVSIPTGMTAARPGVLQAGQPGPIPGALASGGQNVRRGGVRRMNFRRGANPRVQTRAPRQIQMHAHQSSTPAPGCLAPLATPIGQLAAPVKTSLEAFDPDIRMTRREREHILSVAQQEDDRLPTLIVAGLSFSFMDQDELEKVAVVNITKPDLKVSGIEALGTVNDPRMGVVEENQACAKCHLDEHECPGHYGMIKLRVPIVHPLIIRHVIAILNVVCNSCGGLLLSKEELESRGLLKYFGIQRLMLIEKNVKADTPCRRKHDEAGVKRCTPNPKYEITKSTETGRITYKTREGREAERPVQRFKDTMIEGVEDILDSISDEDAELLGFSGDAHPRRMILRALPVMPPCSRPPTVLEGVVADNQFTTIYRDIVLTNNKLPPPPEKGERPPLPQDEKTYRETVERLVFQISHLMDNSDGKHGHRKRPLVAIKDQIQGKEGLIKAFIIGKRVNFAGRTVASPDTSLKFGQIRIPMVMAKILTLRVRVTPTNLEHLKGLMREGQVTHIWPGYGKWKGRRIIVDMNKIEEFQLRPGDGVDRWMQNGDNVLFNRQPTLHKQSIMGAEVVIGTEKTVGLHMSYTTPLNADFDGDEINIHFPQTEEAQAEVRDLMHVSNCIMNAQTNRPIMGLVMNSVTSAYLLTNPDTRMDRDTYMGLLHLITAAEDLHSLDERLERHGVPSLSGQALFSALLPEDFYYVKGKVAIVEGVLVQGIIGKEHIGTSHNSIVQALWKDYGRNRTVDFLTDAPWVLGEYLEQRGFSVGLGDCPLDADMRRQLETEVAKAKIAVSALGSKLEDPLENARRERQIIGKVNVVKDVGARIAKDMFTSDNPFNVMAYSGAKGSVANIAQITGLIGQQFVGGGRMPLTMSRGTRCLPYFEKNDRDPEARGFCPNNFLTGLSPAEQFFLQTGGREGLTDTAVKTADIGFTQHKLVKALEDIRVYPDGSVRNAVGDVFQFTYGNDGFNSAELERVRTPRGEMASFINLRRVVGRINSNFGFFEFDEEDEEDEMEDEGLDLDTPEVDFEGEGE